MAAQMYALSMDRTIPASRRWVTFADNSMYLAWLCLLLMAPCTLLTWPVTCQKPELPGGSTYLSQLTQEIVVAQLKARILRGMNRTEPPHYKMSAIHKAYPENNGHRLIFLSYQPPDVKSKDVVSFRVSPCVLSHIMDVDNVFVAFYVRPVQAGHDSLVKKRQSAWDRKTMRHHKLMKKNARLKKRLQSCKNKFKRLNHSVDEQVGVKGSHNQSSKLSKHANNSFTSNRRENSTLQRFSDNSLLPSHSRGADRVKIIVRVMNTTTERKRNIAVKQVDVKSRMLMLISVPVKYLKRISDSQDQTLSLQILCRGCSRRAWIETVYKSQRRHGKKKSDEKMLNINRPILFIDMKNSTCTDQLWNSLEPGSYSTSLDWVNISQADAWALPKNVPLGQHSEGDD